VIIQVQDGSQDIGLVERGNMKKLIIILIVLSFVGCKTTHSADYNTVKVKKYNKCFSF
jgi:hypothetical protein